MRAAKENDGDERGIHISGGEGLRLYHQIQELAEELLQKALTHERGKPDTIHLSIEKVKENPVFVPPISIKNHEANTVEGGREVACQLLRNIGISENSIQSALQHMKKPKSIRGAALIDEVSGLRLDQRGDKGVRVSRMDWDVESLRFMQKSDSSLVHQRAIEASALANKVAFYPEVVAELCWSDDPGYTTGYVTGQGIYHRIPCLKESGNASGGRVFFIRHDVQNIEDLIHRLERQPVLIGWEKKAFETMNKRVEV